MAKKQAQIFHFDLYGKREDKYDFLKENSINSIEWTELTPTEPELFFVPKDFEVKEDYDKGFFVSDLFPMNSVGVVSGKDEIFVSNSKDELLMKLKDNGFNIENDKIKEISFYPFDNKFIYYDSKLLERAREKIMSNIIGTKNISLVIGKQCVSDWRYIFSSKLITNLNLTGTAGRFGSGYIFPLYLYSENFGKEERTPNLNAKIVAEIEKGLGLKFVAETPPQPSPKGREKNSPPLEGLGEVRPRYVTANPINYVFIKEMRDSLKNNPTEAENVMWEYYRNKKTGHKIRRQHIIDDFITDFVCLSKKVVIEIDGKIHLQQKEYDELRTQRLNELGYEVIRFTNEEVFANPELVALKTKKALDERADVQNETNFPPLEGCPQDGEVFPPEEGNFAPIDILDYIYAVLHSPTYREKYKEFLKIDFPRVPYPKDKETFWKLVELGKQIREIHLLESPVVEQFITQYPESGNNKVTKPRFINSLPLEGCPQDGDVGNVYINETQYFANVPLRAWSFYIGGYQPAQKWLKDRKDRTLEFDDIMHYQKIIVALSETNRLMKEIDTMEIE